MIIYNTTFTIPKELQIEFIKYIRSEYVPNALKDNFISEPRFSRVYSKNDDESFSYALEFMSDNIEKLEEWNNKIGKRLYISLISKFKQNILGFTTVLQPVKL